MRAMWRFVGVGCALVCVTLAIGACGSSKSTSSSTATSSTAAAASGSTTSGSTTSDSAAKAPTGAAYKLGFICSCSGEEASNNALDAEGLKLWAQTVNAGGGIDGHPVDVVTMDDGAIASTAVKDVEQLVQSDHVQALVDESLQDDSFEKYVDKAGVPVLGGTTVLTPFLVDPDWFANGSNGLTDVLGQLQLAKGAGKKVLGDMYCAESSVCAQGAKLFQAASGLLGGIKMAELSVSSTLPSYTAPCLKLRGDGADALYPAGNETVGKSEVDACAQQGYKPLVDANATSGIASWIPDSNFDGGFVVNGSQLPQSTTSPGIAALRAAAKKYDPSILNSPQFDGPVVSAYSGGVMFQQVIKAGKLTPSSTPAQVKAAVPKISGTTLEDLSPPLTIKAGQPTFSPCYFAYKFGGGALTALNGGKAKCVSPAVEEKLEKLLHL